jgi:hypothetical protein
MRYWVPCVAASFVVFALVLVAPISGRHRAKGDNEGRAPLDLRLTMPLRWENGCLVLNLDRINRSSVPLLLTNTGPYVDVALNVTTGDDTGRETIEWVNIYGNSDLINLETTPLTPGAALHNELCLSPTVWIVNLKQETRRELPVRGKLRVLATYFLTEETSKRYREWFYGPSTFEADGRPIGPPTEIEPKQVTIVLPIPCAEIVCSSTCTAPPRGIPGEVRAIPDVYYISAEWGKRGRALTSQLARKYPSCLGDKSIRSESSGAR